MTDALLLVIVLGTILIALTVSVGAVIGFALRRWR